MVTLKKTIRIVFAVTLNIDKRYKISVRIGKPCNRKIIDRN